MWRFPLLSANDIRFGLWPKLWKKKAQGMLWQTKTDLALRRVGLEQPAPDERAQCIGGARSLMLSIDLKSPRVMSSPLRKR